MPNSQTPADQNHQVHHADVLIVTVTQTEGQAMMAAFLGATGQKSIPLLIGERTYRDLGTVGGARVWMAISEMGSGGVGGSQETVRLALASLKPASVIMVGIAFGVDKKKQAMGRVLVAQQLLPYELQRVGNKETLSRGDKAHASPRLLNWLTQANLDWDDAAGKAKFGLILAGAKLIDNRAFRDQVIALAPEAIGGEMEGEGLYVACHNAKTDWILVKAICDWADCNKGRNKDANQKLAASNAARFVVHALQTIPLTGTGARLTGAGALGAHADASGMHVGAGAAGAQAQAQAYALEPEEMLALCDRIQVFKKLDEFLNNQAARKKGLLCLVDHVDNGSDALVRRIHKVLSDKPHSKKVNLVKALKSHGFESAHSFGKGMRERHGLRFDQELISHTSANGDDILLCAHHEYCDQLATRDVQALLHTATSWLDSMVEGPCKVILVLVLRHRDPQRNWVAKLLQRPGMDKKVSLAWQAVKTAMPQFEQLAISAEPLILSDYSCDDFTDWVLEMKELKWLPGHVIAALKKPEEINQIFPHPQRTSRFANMLALLEKHHSPGTL